MGTRYEVYVGEGYYWYVWDNVRDEYVATGRDKTKELAQQAAQTWIDTHGEKETQHEHSLHAHE